MIGQYCEFLGEQACCSSSALRKASTTVINFDFPGLEDSNQGSFILQFVSKYDWKPIAGVCVNAVISSPAFWDALRWIVFDAIPSYF